MEAKLRQVQPAVAESWMPQDRNSSASSCVHPAANFETTQVAKALGPEKKAGEQNTGGGDPGETGKPVDRKLLEEAQSYLDTLNIQLSFSVHYRTKDTVVHVIDNRTGEVIRQIPSDDLLHMREKINALRGLLIDQKG